MTNQLAIMMGQTFQPEHFPITPVMMKVSRSYSTGDSPQGQKKPGASSQTELGDLDDFFNPPS